MAASDVKLALHEQRIKELEHKLDGLSRNVWYLVTAVGLMMGKFILDNVDLVGGDKQTVASFNPLHLLELLLSLVT